MTGSRLQVIADFRSQSLNSGVPPCHHSAMYEYAMGGSSRSSREVERLIRVTGVRIFNTLNLPR